MWQPDDSFKTEAKIVSIIRKLEYARDIGEAEFEWYEELGHLFQILTHQDGESDLGRFIMKMVDPDNR